MENNDKKYGGKQAFRLFLKIVNETELEFNIVKNFLNYKGYYYFFHTDKIDIEDFKEKFKHKTKSLPNAYLTLLKLQELNINNVSFFIGIKENKDTEYGFFNSENGYVYKIGYYKSTLSEIKNFPRFNCVKIIRDRLKESDFVSLKLLHDIKPDIEEWWSKTPSTLKILSEYELVKIIDSKYFKDQDITESLLTHTQFQFINQYWWKDKIRGYVRIFENNVSFNFIVPD